MYVNILKGTCGRSKHLLRNSQYFLKYNYSMVKFWTGLGTLSGQKYFGMVEVKTVFWERIFLSQTTGLRSCQRERTKRSITCELFNAKNFPICLTVLMISITLWLLHSLHFPLVTYGIDCRQTQEKYYSVSHLWLSS